MSDGRICLSNNAAERALRGVAVGRHNWTFAGSDRGGERAAAIYTLIETAKLNGVDPQAWLADVLARLADHPAKRIGELLPWNWRAARNVPELICFAVSLPHRRCAHLLTPWRLSIFPPAPGPRGRATGPGMTAPRALETGGDA